MSSILTFGNHKLPKTTAVMNVCPALVCPSRNLGLCKCADICYARRAEETYGKPGALAHRMKQMEFWMSNTAEEVAWTIGGIQSRRRTPMKALRLNEAGDFWSQLDVDKAAEVAYLLNRRDFIGGCTTYCYTARRDLTFPDEPYFRVMGSGFMVHGQYNVARKGQEMPKADKMNVRCPGDCRKCRVCLDPKGRTVWAREH
jgi:hypothetical protein